MASDVGGDDRRREGFCNAAEGHVVHAAGQSRPLEVPDRRVQVETAARVGG